MTAGPRPPTVAPSPLAFLMLGAALATLGFLQANWWALAGATSALAAAAWRATEPADPPGP